MARYTGYYKDVYCSNKSELAFVLYNDYNNIKFIRNEYQFKYDGDIYIPPFKMNDGTYIETNPNKDISMFKSKIVKFDKKTLNRYISFCKSKYGTDFERLLKES